MTQQDVDVLVPVLVTFIVLCGLVIIALLVAGWFQWFFKYTSGETKKQLTAKIEKKYEGQAKAEQARHDAVVEANVELAKAEVAKRDAAIDDLSQKYKAAAEQADKYKEQLDKEEDMSKIVLIDDAVDSKE